MLDGRRSKLLLCSEDEQDRAISMVTLEPINTSNAVIRCNNTFTNTEEYDEGVTFSHNQSAALLRFTQGADRADLERVRDREESTVRTEVL